jgi:hypothetical protein
VEHIVALCGHLRFLGLSDRIQEEAP